MLCYHLLSCSALLKPRTPDNPLKAQMPDPRIAILTRFCFAPKWVILTRICLKYSYPVLASGLTNHNLFPYHLVKIPRNPQAWMEKFLLNCGPFLPAFDWRLSVTPKFTRFLPQPFDEKLRLLPAFCSQKSPHFYPVRIRPLASRWNAVEGDEDCGMASGIRELHHTFPVGCCYDPSGQYSVSIASRWKEMEAVDGQSWPIMETIVYSKASRWKEIEAVDVHVNAPYAHSPELLRQRTFLLTLVPLPSSDTCISHTRASLLNLNCGLLNYRIFNLAPRTRSLTSATPASAPSVSPASSSLPSLPSLSNTSDSEPPSGNSEPPSGDLDTITSDHEDLVDNSLDSDFDDDYIMSTRLSANGRIDYGNNKSASPLVKQRVGFDIFDYTDLRDSIEDYAKQNKLTAQSDTRDLLRKAWRDFKEDRMWFRMNKDKHDGLSDAEFDAILRSRFLGATWPSDVASLRAKSKMKPTGSGAFADYAGEVLSLNCELQGTNYFFDNKQLLALLSDGLIRAFREDLVYEKLEITPSTDLDQWISSVVDFETRSRWRHPRPANSNSNFPLTSSSSHNTSSAVRQTPRHNTGPISVEEITSLVQKSKSSKNNHFAGQRDGPVIVPRTQPVQVFAWKCLTVLPRHR
ncbi:hypothetical protein C8R42DRAFT_751770 [Lentinula raphanica]|nr:hypothetical protein C8R42DRAFT_751770 [Lentinula raphanica]